MDNLRQKIEGLKIDKTRIKDAVDSNFTEASLIGIARNQAIDDVLEILNEAVAEKDSPYEEGTWWYLFKDENGKTEPIPIDVLIAPENEFQYVIFGSFYDPSEFADSFGYGKWVKAIMPEPKGE